MKKEFELEVHAQVVTYFTYNAESEQEIRDLWDRNDEELMDTYNYKMMKLWDSDTELTNVKLVTYPYLIVETWNGPGYSEENLLREVKEFENDEAAHNYLKQLVDKEQDGMRIQKIDNGYAFMVDNDVCDAGSYQFFRKQYLAYACVIFCNTNEVKVLTKEEYTHFLEGVWKLVVQDVFDDDGEPMTLEQALKSPRFFIHAEDYNGDYDYQLQVIEPVERSQKAEAEPVRDNPVVQVTLAWAKHVKEQGQEWSTAEQYTSEAQEFISNYYFEDQEVADITALEMADQSWIDYWDTQGNGERLTSTLEDFIDFAFSNEENEPINTGREQLKLIITDYLKTLKEDK